MKPSQLDALREVANIGAGHAATALSQLTERRIMINVPEVTVARWNEVPGFWDPEEQVVAVWMMMMGNLTGRTAFVLPLDNARRLCGFLLHRDPTPENALNEMEESTLKETGNILGGAYLSALSTFLGMMLLPSVPDLVVNRSAAVFDPIAGAADGASTMIIRAATEFRFDGTEGNLVGHYILLPDAGSVQAILEAIQLA
ncbi:MAG: chemotaxis protein CheC [Gemmatimonadetes bacterium]|nr:chemotaxis protein CheC [Gemmatimonadota bacterium]